MSNPFARAPQPAAAQQQKQAPGFGQPNKGGGSAITQADWKEFIGCLMLFEVIEYRTGLVTKNTKPGETTAAVVANVHVIDHPEEPKVFDRALVFPPALVTATKEVRDENGHLVVSAGDRPYMVLGRLAELTTQAGRETVQLVDHDAADVKTATDYLAWRQGQQMAGPTQQQAPPDEEPPF